MNRDGGTKVVDKALPWIQYSRDYRRCNPQHPKALCTALCPHSTSLHTRTEACAPSQCFPVVTGGRVGRGVSHVTGQNKHPPVV